jgi:hypothetical protein
MKLTKAERWRRRQLIEEWGNPGARVIAIDPGGLTQKKTRGFAHFHNGRVCDTLNDLEAMATWAFSVALCESQWANPKASRQSLITLGQGAGFLLGSVNARLKLMVPVFAWKDALIPGFANAPKEMYTKNLQQMWPGISNPHCLDAVGLGAAFTRGLFTTEQMIDWVVD